MTFTGSGEERQQGREAFRKFPEPFLKCKSRNQTGAGGVGRGGGTIIGGMEEKPHS